MMLADSKLKSQGLQKFYQQRVEDDLLISLYKFSPVASFVFKVQHYNLDITKRIYKCIRAVVFDIHWLSCLYKYIYIYIYIYYIT